MAFIVHVTPFDAKGETGEYYKSPATDHADVIQRANKAAKVFSETGATGVHVEVYDAEGEIVAAVIYSWKDDESYILIGSGQWKSAGETA